MDKKLSVVIPTIQKNTELLIKLLSTLNEDASVDEIILIDNSLKGIDYSNPKLRIITPKENLYVNPSWNLGVKEAKNDYVALLNDDIIISNNFCSQIVSNMTPEMGCVGMNSSEYVSTTDVIQDNLDNNKIELKYEKYMDLFWGIAIFFHKNAYNEIPEELKIIHGDTWIFEKAKKQGKKNYFINNQLVYHFGSLSHGDKSFNPVCINDKKIFDKMFYPWYRKLFSIEGRLNGIRIWLFGLKLIFSFRKRKSLVEKEQ